MYMCINWLSLVYSSIANMLNSDADQTVMDFPMSSAKPGHYSDKEVPQIPELTKRPETSSQKSTSCLEKIYQVTTSLPGK